MPEDRNQMSAETAKALSHFAEAIDQKNLLRTTLNELTERVLLKGNPRKVLEGMGYTTVQVKAYYTLQGLTWEYDKQPSTAKAAPAEPKVKAPKAPPAKAAPDVVAAPAAAPSTDKATLPSAVTIGGATTPTKNWREVYTNLVYRVIDAGKDGGVSTAWLRPAPDATRPSSTMKLPDGRFLEINISREVQVKRCKKLSGILGLPVTITMDGQEVDIPG